MPKIAVFDLKKVYFYVIFESAITRATIKLETSLDKICDRRNELYNSTVTHFSLF